MSLWAFEFGVSALLFWCPFCVHFVVVCVRLLVQSVRFLAGWTGFGKEEPQSSQRTQRERDVRSSLGPLVGGLWFGRCAHGERSWGGSLFCDTAKEVHA